MSFKILGMGSAVPEYVLTNDEVATIVDTSDEWISTRTGIKGRHVCTNETITDLAFSAVKKALKDSGVSPSELDYIICSTIQGDYITPSMSCLIQNEIGAGCPSFDINAACSGFIYLLDVASTYFDSGKAKNILVVSAENMTRFADFTDRATCVLFGDAAAAMVLTKGDGLLSMKLTSHGGTSLMRIGGSQGNSPFSKAVHEKPFLYMNGPEVYKFAVNAMTEDLAEVVEKANIKLEDVTHVIPHQANIRIINTAKKKLGLRDDQIVACIDRFGNTSSASVPLAVDTLKNEGGLKRGDILALSAFGGGLTTGACVIKY